MFDMMEFLNKLKSRKFLTCIAGVMLGVCMVFGLDEGTVNTISGAITAIVSIATYIYSEGKIDAVAVDKIKDTVDEVKDAYDAVNKIEE
jgi:phage shock protein PspC (stress-responsive transcriptional regulator)